MKKTLVVCVALVALLAVAGSANAITCTIDSRPAATLLIPYFQASFNPDLTILGTGASALDTLVTIGNASAAPMIAHVNVFNERSVLVLDFNIALTGFDIQSFSVASVLRGFLPQTPVLTDHTVSPDDACQRNPKATVFPDPDGFLRTRPGTPATGLDNTLATTLYPAGPFPTSFLQQVVDSLDVTPDSLGCGSGTVDGTITNPIHGYITIDHANYCNLSNPSDPAYYTNDAIGMENNLWGDYIFTNGVGLGTMGFPAVEIEADPSLADSKPTGATATSVRTFYGRYVINDPAGCAAGNTVVPAADCGAGDQREPLGLKYAARWFDAAPNVTSSFNVWRASAGTLKDLTGTPGGDCTDVEPVVTLTFFDEDENTVTSGVCPSPGTQPTFNFPLETQRANIAGFSHPTWPAGWVNMEFFNGTGPNAGAMDQAYVTYDFAGATAFLSAGVPAAQLDPSSCNPLGVVGPPIILPVIPALVGTGI